MEEKSREVVMAISNAARYMDPFFKLSAMGTILLLQYFARMVKERKLKETEFRYGPITGKYVINRNKNAFLKDVVKNIEENVSYLNVEEYLKQLS